MKFGGHKLPTRHQFVLI